MNAVPEGLTRERIVVGAFMRGWAVVACVLFATAVNSHTQGAQISEPPLPVDPRPLTQLISDAEKGLIGQADNPKKLVEAYLKISDTHLQAALNLIGVNNHGASERELDVYNKAVAAAAKEAFVVQENKRSLSKRIEQVLYKQIKTLETIERLFPSEREVFAEAALRQTKQLRVQALNAAFDSGGVLKDPDGDKKPESEPLLEDGEKEIREEPLMSQWLPPRLARAASLQTAGRVLPVSTAPLAGQPGGVSFRGGVFGEQPTNSLRRPSAVGAVIPIAVRLEKAPGLSQLPGDYLTDEEDQHVREAQAADARATVFMKIADRRLKAIVGPAASPAEKKDQKKVEEEEREWGAVPKVSRTELLRHYARAISECMAKLEDAYERNPKSSALPKALSVLRDSTDKHLQTLRALKAEMTTEAEVAAMSGAIYEAETANKGARDGMK